MVTGTIVLWYGAILDIPTGWSLCDGNNGTPNLQNKFIVGAGDTYAVDGTGGAITHTHPFSSDGHTHDIPGGSDIGSGANFANTSDNRSDGGTSDAGSTLPPYHALAYIMKT